MSTCPEKDIHSVYLDGELPESYVQKYEEHLKTCPECKKQMESLKLLRKVFQADKNSMELSPKDMDESFERLQARLSFAKHTKPSNVVDFKPKAFVSAALGAVAALALVFVPSQLSSRSKNAAPVVTASFTPVANVDLVSPSTILLHHADGELSSSVAHIFSEGETFVGNGEALLNAFSTGLNTVSYPSNVAKKSRRNINTATKLASYDIFTPVPDRKPVAENSWVDENAANVEFPLGSLYLENQGE